MTALFGPVAGKDGNIVIADNNYPADSVQIVTTTEQVPIYTVSSVPFVDQLPGWTSSVIVAAGTYQIGFNPFVPARGYLYQGSYQKIVYQPWGGGFYIFPSALVLQWTFTTSAKGTSRWQLMAAGDYNFKDFSGELAA